VIKHRNNFKHPRNNLDEMSISIAGKRYSDREWKEALQSNEGLFAKLKVSPSYAGPQLTKDLEITGDVLAFERSIFEKYASQFQVNVFDEIRKQSEEKANEYLLTICGAIDKWKQDVKVLQDFLAALKEEKKELRNEEKTVHKAEIIFHIPDVLRRRMPEVFAKLELDVGNIEVFLHDLKNAEEKIEFLEKRINIYLADLKKNRHFGFLF